MTNVMDNEQRVVVPPITPAGRPPKGRKRWKLVLGVVLSVLGFLAVSGAVTMFVLSMRNGSTVAPINYTDSGGWNRLGTPDGTGNVYSRCNPYQAGTRIYVTAGHAPVVIADANCDAAGQPRN